jgi:hypothetical protein
MIVRDEIFLNRSLDMSLERVHVSYQKLTLLVDFQPILSMLVPVEERMFDFAVHCH